MWYEISCRDRILSWRNWRKTLDTVSLEEAVNETALKWVLVPRINHYLVPEEVDLWPTPWELITDNYYCDIAIALGMFYSLALSSHRTDHTFSIDLYRDDDASTWYNLCQVDQGKYILNWELGAVVNNSTLPQTARLVYRYTSSDLAGKM